MQLYFPEEEIVAAPGSGKTPETVLMRDRVLWVALAACGSIVLLAMTNQISQDIAVVPFLWILPLSLYLISFIVCFDKDAWYHRGIWITLLVISLAPLLYLMFQELVDASVSLVDQVGIYCLALFACGMVCHGELARRRSTVPHLTTFYLYVALGGALGGVFVNLLAPLLFAGFWELHVGLAGTVVLAGICIVIDKPLFGSKQWRTGFAIAWSAASISLILLLGLQIRTGSEDTIYYGRGFFGVMFVSEWDEGTSDHERRFFHGKIQHGRQLMNESRQRWATSYYGVDSGVATAILHHPRRQSGDASTRALNIGIVGLGVGTLSTYGTEIDSIRFYEINPQVEEVARTYFSYLQSSRAATEVLLGDARISMERELEKSGSNKFDVLVLDAFSSDSIPVHLLTEEAFDLYASHVRPDGVLAVHITNQYLDLSNVVRVAAQRMGKEAVWVKDYAKRWYEDGNDWILITSNSAFLQSAKVRGVQTTWDSRPLRPIRWTDNFSNLFEVLVWE